MCSSDLAMSQGDFGKITVSPSSFKRIVHELRREHGRYYIVAEGVKTNLPGGTPFARYQLNPDIRRQIATEGPTVIDGYEQGDLFA